MAVFSGRLVFPLCHTSRHTMNRKLTMEDHVNCGLRIDFSMRLLNFLIEEMHRKKCQSIRGVFTPNDSAVDDVYRHQLFHGQEAVCMGVFPDTLRSVMESVMFREHGNDERCTTRVYYRTGAPKDDAAFARCMGKTMTPLSGEETITDTDKETISAFNRMHMRLMDDAIDQMALSGISSCESRRVRKWRDTVRKEITESLLRLSDPQ